MHANQVFVSHTSDMAQFPEGRSFVQAALDAVSRAGMVPVDMRYFAARDGKPADYCRQRVRECEVYVAVMGFQYGSLVTGETVSYTELEFDEASKAGLPRLVFLLDETVSLPSGLADPDRGAVDGFRRRLRDGAVVFRGYHSDADLELEVFHALTQLAGGPRQAERPALAERYSPRPGTAAFAGRNRRLQRQLMIQRQKAIWIDGALANSLEAVSRIELGLASKPAAVQRPWTMVLRDTISATRVVNVRGPIGRIFDQAGGALLILGAPGGGKTTLLLELAADLIARAESDQDLPIPVIFNLSTWGRSLRPLEQWLEDELHRRYTVPRGLARQWLTDDMIVPLLDGLDEVKADKRGSCVTAINKYMTDHGLLQIAVCCRISDYEDIGSRLKLNTAVEVQPIGPEQILSYLEAAGEQLAGLRSAVTVDRELLELLSTPLLLSVAAITYQNTTAGELAAEAKHGDRRQQLIESYIRRALQRRSSHGTYPSSKVLAWLGVLAHQMSRHDQTVYYVEWMQPTWLGSRFLKAAAAWVFPVLLGGVVGFSTGYTINFANVLGARLFGRGNNVYVAGIPGGWFAGAAAGVLTLVFGFSSVIRPAESLTWSLSALRSNASRQIRSGLITGTILAGAIGIIMKVWGAATVVAFAVLFELLSVIFYLIIGGVSPTLREVHTVPNEGIRRSLYNALLVGIPGGTLVGIIAGSAFGVRLTLQFGLIDGIIVGGVVFVLAAMHAGGRAWLHHFAMRGALIVSGQVPVRWVRFLQYSTDNILLRRVGGGYAFIHRIFLEHFVHMHLSSHGRGAAAHQTAD